MTIGLNIERALLAFCGVLLLGSTGAFLLYVSAVSILTMIVSLLGLMLMFLLGVQTARQPAPLPSKSGLHLIPSR